MSKKDYPEADLRKAAASNTDVGVPSAMLGAAPVPGVVKDAGQKAPAMSGVVAV